MSEKTTGLLIVSFGSSYHEALKNDIEAIEKEMQERCPQMKVYRAFTSGIIIDILKKRDHIHVDTVDEALVRMAREGIKDLKVLPTHIIGGTENDRMLAAIAAGQHLFDSVRVASPLLSEEKDYITMAKMMIDAFKLQNEEALILMGHGTVHPADTCYRHLQEVFVGLGQDHIYIVTVEGALNLPDLIPTLKAKGIKCATLAPFMITAGDHARNDMAGGEPGSMASLLKAQGIEANCILKGLGSYPQARQHLYTHLEAIMDGK